MILGIIDIDSDMDYILYHRRLHVSIFVVVNVTTLRYPSVVEVSIIDGSPRLSGGVYIFYPTQRKAR
jgi:hypothetical protein